MKLLALFLTVAALALAGCGSLHQTESAADQLFRTRVESISLDARPGGVSGSLHFRAPASDAKLVKPLAAERVENGDAPRVQFRTSELPESWRQTLYDGERVIEPLVVVNGTVVEPK
jgi:hypothetical protein